MFKSGSFLLGLVLLLFSQMVVAATATGTLSVMAIVGSTCMVAPTGNTIPFGTYTGAINNTNGTINITCTNGNPYSVALNVGTGAGASYTNRVLTNPSPAGTLNYNIYTTGVHTTVWGDGTLGTGVISGTGSGSSQILTAFGQIPAGQLGTPGNYTDTVTITVTF
jgi:spore coat protein U-like protein